LRLLTGLIFSDCLERIEVFLHRKAIVFRKVFFFLFPNRLVIGFDSFIELIRQDRFLVFLHQL